MVTVFAPHLKNPDTGEQGPVLSLHVSRAAGSRLGAELRRGRRAGRHLRHRSARLQANEIVKLILGIGRPAIGRLITYSST